MRCIHGGVYTWVHTDKYTHVVHTKKSTYIEECIHEGVFTRKKVNTEECTLGEEYTQTEDTTRKRHIHRGKNTHGGEVIGKELNTERGTYGEGYIRKGYIYGERYIQGK